MGQSGDAPSGTPSDPVNEDEQSFVEQYFWPLLAGAVLIPLVASTAVVYLQYETVDETLRSVPYFEEVNRYGNQAVQALPYVGAAASDTSASRDYGSFTRLKGLVVNPAGSGGNRYLALSIAFESKSPAVIKEISSKEVVVRDAILTLLSERTVEELSDPNQRDELKKVLLKETNQILSRGTIDRLYFTEFVLQ